MASPLAALVLIVASLFVAEAVAASPAATCGRPSTVGGGTSAGGCGSGPGVVLLQTRSMSERVTTAEGEEIHSGDVVLLKVARTSNRLTAQADGTVHAKWAHRGSWQQFVIDKETGSGAIEGRDKVFLTAWTGKPLTVQQETVHAKWGHKGSWQMLTLSRKAGPGPVANGDSIFLRGHLGKFLDADAPGSDGSVHARFEHEGSWQELIVEAFEPRTTTTTTTTPAPECVEKQGLGMCQPCLHSEQCEVGSYCCPYMKKCVKSSGQGCGAPMAECVPMCYDGVDPRECQCGNENFPDDWQLPTCEASSGLDSPSAQPTPGVGDGVADGGEEPVEVSAVAWEHFRLLNQLRAEGFTCPEGAAFAPNPTSLKFDCRLWRAARLHTEDMAEHSYFSHTSQDGRSPWKRADDQGTSASGENIAAGRSGAGATLEQLESSDHHCQNMLNPEFKVAAVGYAAGGHYTHYWTQMFSELDTSDLDTSCYPPADVAPNLLGVTAAAVRPHEHSVRPEEEDQEPALPEPAVRTG